MSKQLEQFIEAILVEPSTHISVSSPKQIESKPGFVIDNANMNARIRIFSEPSNTYYFELSYHKDKDGESAYHKISTYKTTNYFEVKTILDKVCSQFEGQYNKSFIDAEFYVELFKKFLRNEPLPAPYSIKQNLLRLELKGIDSEEPCYIQRSNIEDEKFRLRQTQDPTYLILLDVVGIPTTTDDEWGIICILNNNISQYPLLQPNTKYQDIHSLNLTLNDWFNEAKDVENVDAPALTSLIEYVLLKDELSSNDEPCNQKSHKPRCVKI